MSPSLPMQAASTIINSTLTGIYTAGPLSVTNSVFSSCFVGLSDGNCIYATATAMNVTIHKTTFVNILTPGRGAAIYADISSSISISQPLQSNVYVYDSFFTNCNAKFGNGACIFAGNVYVYRSISHLHSSPASPTPT